MVNQNSNLVVNALDMAIENWNPVSGGIVHAGHGVKFTSRAFTNRIRQAGLMPSFGLVGDRLDNAMMESFWAGMQIELLCRKRKENPDRVSKGNTPFWYIARQLNLS
jgi:transposase InsO family protein